MSDPTAATPKKLDELLQLFADNTTGNITARDMRDMIVSVAPDRDYQLLIDEIVGETKEIMEGVALKKKQEASKLVARKHSAMAQAAHRLSGKKESMQIEMTGREDLEGALKIAVCGFPGAGKTMFASTAPDPLFIFFRQAPRIKSIASRHIPHVKFTNELDGSTVVRTVQNKLFELLNYLQGPHEYQTIVFDTGDELLQALKEGRRAENNGTWGPDDWNWLGDMYREIMGAFIDLPLHIISLFHIKINQSDETPYREIALQGSAKDEAAGWFDIVGVLEPYQVDSDDGKKLVRMLVTSPSQRTPFLKDHYGVMPPMFPLSDDFVGDFTRLRGLIRDPQEVGEKEVIGNIEAADTEPLGAFSSGSTKTEVVPSPQDLKTVKSNTTKGTSKPKKVRETKPVEEVLAKELNAEEVPNKCAVCGEDVEAELSERSQWKYDKVLCQVHWKEERQKNG